MVIVNLLLNDAYPYKELFKGDNIYLSIACASIIAKVEHDKYIDSLIIEKPFLKNYININLDKKILQRLTSFSLNRSF